MQVSSACGAAIFFASISFAVAQYPYYNGCNYCYGYNYNSQPWYGNGGYRPQPYRPSPYGIGGTLPVVSPVLNPAVSPYALPQTNALLGSPYSSHSLGSLGGVGGLGGLGAASTGCYDRSTNCAYLVSMGECATNPVATRALCPISCGTGCLNLPGFGVGYGTMDALADGGLTSLYSNSLLSPFGGIYDKKSAKERVPPRPLTTTADKE